MADITIALQGLGEWDRALDELVRRVDAATATAVVEGAHLVERRAKLNSSTGSHPRGEGHVPGTGPGPNVVSGSHRRSFVVVGPYRRPDGAWAAATGPTMVYSRALELGHPAWPSGRRFPYLGPALEYVRAGALAGVFARAWARAARG